MSWEQRWRPLRRERVVVAVHCQNRSEVGAGGFLGHTEQEDEAGKLRSSSQVHHEVSWQT